MFIIEVRTLDLCLHFRACVDLEPWLVLREADDECG